MVETRSGGRRPGGREGTRSHTQTTSSSTNYKEIEKAIGSRPKFDDNVVKQVYSNARKSVNANGETTYECAASREFFTKDQTSIDHIIDWKTHCEDYCQRNNGIFDNGTLDRDIVREGYNDISNLRVVSKSENSSKGDRRISSRRNNVLS
ncbi:hypothetical protein [Nostoc sp.]|uniref:hypothetical protein n=1 Tax=Nostoc sp. TaxID=1180 RepID=UPI002FF51C20